MRSVGGILIALATLGIGIWLGRAGSAAGPAGSETVSTATAAGEAVATPEKVSAGTASALHFQGVATCASIACHGGPRDSKEKWRSSYSVWATQDRHSRAYAVLFEPRAKRMVALLNHAADAKANPSPPAALPQGERGDSAASGSEPKPWLENRCLACHSLGTAPSEGHAAVDASLLADGVGCEACHGAAEHWLSEHTKATWASRTDRYSDAWGMKNTPDLRVRAETCVGCHVGAAAKEGQPARDVNHDLIAAGHPRLNFEYSAYLANLPRHWDDAKDRERYPDFDARAWAVGQGVSARAALELLASRADGASPNANPLPPAPLPQGERGEAVATPPAASTVSHAAPWPEFSEYDCFACHHELREPSYRQALAKEHPRRQPLGTLPWGTWYYSGLRDLIAAEPSPDGKACLAGLDELAQEMSRPRADGAKVGRQAASAAVQMESLIAQWSRGPLEPDRSTVLWKSLLDDTAPPDNWDEASQTYLAITALNAARRAQHKPDGGKPLAHDDQIEKAIQELRATLEFPAPPDAGKTHEAAVRFDSPRDFDPQKFAVALSRLRDLFAEEHK